MYHRVLALSLCTSCLIIMLAASTGIRGMHQGPIPAPTGSIRLGQIDVMAFTAVEFSTPTRTARRPYRLGSCRAIVYANHAAGATIGLGASAPAAERTTAGRCHAEVNAARQAVQAPAHQREAHGSAEVTIFAEIVHDLQAALAQIAAIAEDLGMEHDLDESLMG